MAFWGPAFFGGQGLSRASLVVNPALCPVNLALCNRTSIYQMSAFCFESRCVFNCLCCKLRLRVLPLSIAGVVGSERVAEVRFFIIREDQCWVIDIRLCSHHLRWLQRTSRHVTIPTVVTGSPWWRHTRHTQAHLSVHYTGKRQTDPRLTPVACCSSRALLRVKYARWNLGLLAKHFQKQS